MSWHCRCCMCCVMRSPPHLLCAEFFDSLFCELYGHLLSWCRATWLSERGQGGLAFMAMMGSSC
jgi:hypothetical protein